MNGFFSYTESTMRFQTFSLNHILPMLVIIVGVILIYMNKERLRHSKYEKHIRYTMAIMAILTDISFQIWQGVHGEWTLVDSLPLHLCRLTNYLGIYILFTKDNRVFSIAYFWSLGGVVSILFPDILHGPDRYRYYHFMISHILFFFMYMYLLFVNDLKLTFTSWKKSVLALFLLATLIVIPVNFLFDVNYMYLRYPGDTPFSLFENDSYFLYAIGCIGLTFVVIALWYVPIYFYNKKLK